MEVDIRKAKDSEELQILTLESKEKADEFLENLDNYEDYLMTRYAESITKGHVACEIAQYRDGDMTHVVCVELTDFDPIFEKGINDSIDERDFKKAAMYTYLKQQLEKLLNDG